MAQQLFSVGLALSSMLEKARAKDKESWQEEIRDIGALSCKG
jgi:signal transduction histidine kinase